jgi:hypothetical protein
MTHTEDTKGRILYLLSMRKIHLDKYYNSYDETIGEFGEYTIDEPKEIDELAEQIYNKIKKYKDILSIDFIIENLTKLGDSPNILYDDNGNFAVESTGIQTVSKDEPIDIEMTFLIKKDSWFPNIREALNYYLDQED